MNTDNNFEIKFIKHVLLKGIKTNYDYIDFLKAIKRTFIFKNNFGCKIDNSACYPSTVKYLKQFHICDCSISIVIRVPIGSYFQL